MQIRDCVTAIHIILESGIVRPVVRRDYLNDDGTLDHSITLDGAHGQSPELDDPALLRAAQTFAEIVAPHVRERFKSADLAVHDGVAVAQARAEQAAALA